MNPLAHVKHAAWELTQEGLKDTYKEFGNTAGVAAQEAKMASPLAKAMPFVGAGIGAAQFGYHGYEAYQHRDEINGGYADNEFWKNTGEATLGGAGAIASFCPPAALYLGAGELALNTVGGIAGAINPKYGFSAGSAVGAAEHLAYDGVNTAVEHGTHSVGGGIGGVAGGIMGSVLGPAGVIAGAAGGAWLGDKISGWFGGGDKH